MPLSTLIRWLSMRDARPVRAVMAPSSAGMSMLTLLDMGGSYPL